MVYTITDFGPNDLLTTDIEGFRRLKVDVGQTGLALGRQFRTFKELSINAGQSLVIAFSSPVNFVLSSQDLTVDAGAIKFTAEVEGTPSGSFSDILPVVGRNRWPTRPQPYYEAQASIASGGDYTGGTVVELVRVVSSGSSAQKATVGGQFASERLLPAGTFYLRLANIGNGTATGVYTISWEEVP